jgi:hypothetical protein
MEGEHEYESIHRKLDTLLILVEHLTNKVEQLECKKKKTTIEYKLQPYRFPQMRCQNLMKEMLTELVETQCQHNVKRLIGDYNCGGCGSILSRLVQETFNRPELMNIYIKGLRFYVYTSNAWVEWKKPRKDCLRNKFWHQYKAYMRAYMSREDDYLSKDPCWDLLIDTETFAGHVTKRAFIRNIMRVNGEYSNLSAPFGNTYLTSTLLKNYDLMAQNRRHFKKRL